MALVDQLNIVRGTDRQFTLIVTDQTTRLPKDLSAFVGQSGDILKLTLPGDSADIELTLDTVDASKIEVESAAAGLAGKVKVTLSDTTTAALKARDGQGMELCIKEGAGPDYDISKVQFIGVLNVKKQLFA
jgi:hypothetical protein